LKQNKAYRQLGFIILWSLISYNAQSVQTVECNQNLLLKFVYKNYFEIINDVIDGGGEYLTTLYGYSQKYCVDIVYKINDQDVITSKSPRELLIKLNVIDESL
jgi:hypothetical protein